MDVNNKLRDKIMKQYNEKKKTSRVALDRLKETKEFESMYETLETAQKLEVPSLEYDYWKITKVRRTNKK